MIAAQLALPGILLLFGLYCLFSRRNTLPSFIDGASNGLKASFELIPTLVLLMTAISMFSASGAADYIAKILSPYLAKIGIPSELVPLIIIRPISGSGGTAILSDILEVHGPDSIVGRCASVMCASSDTLFYVITVYMSAAGVRKTRHTLPAAIIVMLLGVLLPCIAVRLFY